MDAIDKYHSSKKGRITFGTAEIIIAYLFVSLAINSGSIWQYVVAGLLFIGGVNNLIKSVVHKPRINGKKPKR